MESTYKRAFNFLSYFATGRKAWKKEKNSNLGNERENKQKRMKFNRYSKQIITVRVISGLP